MTPDEIRRRLAGHEDNFTERKPEGANAAELRRTVVAWRNIRPDDRNAILFIGVHDDGRILGCTNPNSIQKTVRRLCEQDCFPPINFSSEVITTNSGPVVAVVVPPSDNRHHFSGPAFVRKRSESVAASEAQFNELVHSRNSTAAAILKLKGQVIILIGLGHKLGSTRRDVTRDYREGGETRVLECNALTARFELIASGTYVTEPLDHIRVTYNEEKHKPMLVVSGY